MMVQYLILARAGKLLPLLILPPFSLPERILYLQIHHTRYHPTMNVTGDDGLFSLAYALESHGKFTQYYSTTTIALCLVTLLTAALGYFNRGNVC